MIFVKIDLKSPAECFNVSILYIALAACHALYILSKNSPKSLTTKIISCEISECFICSVIAIVLVNRVDTLHETRY